MKGYAALLLAVLAICQVALAGPAKATTEAETTTELLLNKEKNAAKKLLDLGKPVLNAKDILLQEIRTLGEDVPTDKLQESLAKATKPPKKNGLPVPKISTTAKTLNATTTDEVMNQLLNSEDLAYNGDDDEGDDLDDDDDDDYDEDEEDDELDEDEETEVQCPNYCRCSGQYSSTTTARCTKLTDEQIFGPSIAHLKIENAGEIKLGPHALRAKGLQQLESITIVDTKIVDLDRTAFDGIPYLFAVNLTRNSLVEIHPDTFQNNTQLSLLTISGQPLRTMQTAKEHRDYLLDAPSVTELDFSGNLLARLPRTAFLKMPNLAYISLKNNRLRSVERSTFNPLDSLVELDLSSNQLSGLPVDLFDGKGLQTLRISGNSFSTLTSIKAMKLNLLDASNNKIKNIGKDDLVGMPAIDQLFLKSNGIKKIHQHAFSELDQLTYLDMSDNKITSLTAHHLKSNSRLQIILLNDNPNLESLPVFKTSGQEYNTYSVYRFECSNCGLYFLEIGTFNEMPALTRLNLARNRLTNLPKNLLHPLSSLRELDLSDNLIDTLESDMFRGAASLSKINLSGNKLVSLQVAPFLNTPSLSRLDASRCGLRRVWSEARVPLKSLRFLSVRGNLLQRITVEELKATPKLSGLDVSRNPLACDEDFNAAVQWLIEHGVTPTETLRYISNYENAEEDYAEAEGIGQWTDLAKVVCQNIDDGPVPRPVPHKPVHVIPAHVLPKFDLPDDTNTLLRDEIEGDTHDDEIDDAWSSQDQEYEEFALSKRNNSLYMANMWGLMTVILVTVAVVLLVAHFALCVTKRNGRGPVIRPPMILRQGLIDNKNCGLVYKPLQEELPTPHMPKRGSFYSSSTFHYDKIVPESV